MLCPIEEWSRDIIYSYNLSKEERKHLEEMCYATDNKDHMIEGLRGLEKDMGVFLQEHPGPYFLRLSTLSPKDAWYLLEGKSFTEEDLDAMPRLDLLLKELGCLKIMTVQDCINTLTHSIRVRFDLDHDNSLVLLPWKEISHATEIRCFVKNSLLVGFAHYYDIHVDNPRVLARNVVDFFKTFRPICSDCVVDIHIPDQVCVIEYNPLNETTDAIQTTWEEIHSLKEITYFTMDETLVYNVDF